MKNLDVLKQKKLEFAEKFRAALDSKDDARIVEVFESYSESITDEIKQIAIEFSQTTDSAILASRGVRQLTAEEKSFYEGVMGAMKAPDPKAALTGVDNTFPVTIIDSVIEDIKANHPLLDAIDFQNTTASTKWIYDDSSTPLATWGKLTSAIVEEMSAAIGVVDFNLTKLTAFIPIPKDLLDLAPSYLDAYVRAFLSEASANGLEYGFFKGNGKNQPIGFIKNLSSYASDGSYNDKEKVVLNSFEAADYCDVIASLAERPNGSYRAVTAAALIVNPVDFINRVIPATTALATDGTYKSEIFPFPTTVFSSAQVAKGEAVLGIMKNGKIYYKAFYAGALAKIDYSDEVNFLEDERVYITKIYAYGRPVDNTSFVYLDISNLKQLTFKVKLVPDEEPVTYAYTQVASPEGNPSTSGYYELIGGAMVASEDTEVDNEKVYYTRTEVEG